MNSFLRASLLAAAVLLVTACRSTTIRSWAVSTDTFNPTSAASEAPGFADVVIRELRARNLIAGAPK
jgi:hypothetical protein